jgi:hypothetical protein
LLIIQNWKITLQLSYKKKKNKENKGGLGLKKYHSPSQQPHQDGWIILQNYITFLSKQAHQQEFKLQATMAMSSGKIQDVLQRCIYHAQNKRNKLTQYYKDKIWMEKMNKNLKI